MGDLERIEPINVPPAYSDIQPLFATIQRTQELYERSVTRRIDDVKEDIASAKEAAKLASKSVAELSVRMTGERGDNGLCGRVATLEAAMRSHVRFALWLGGIVGSIVTLAILGGLRALGMV